MSSSAPAPILGEEFYSRVLDILAAAEVEFLVGGAFAMRVLTGIERDTKDFDIMLRPRDVDRALQVCRDGGFPADYAFSHWIAKVHHKEHFIDLIYRAGNGLCEVDDSWFAAASEADLLGHRLRLCPVEEMIRQKAYIMERERFDGADVLHLLRGHALRMDWERLLRCFGDDWRVLLSHLILFGYVYPAKQSDIPAEVLERLLAWLRSESQVPVSEESVCRGTFLSRAQYLPDVERLGHRDARTDERVRMTPHERSAWTNAIDHLRRSR